MRSVGQIRHGAKSTSIRFVYKTRVCVLGENEESWAGVCGVWREGRVAVGQMVICVGHGYRKLGDLVGVEKCRVYKFTAVGVKHNVDCCSTVS